MHNIWVATDLHLSNREDNKQHPFLTQRERQQMYDNYAAMIQPDDLLIFLGDLFDVGTIDHQEIGRFLHNIKGHIIMCRGNHDDETDEFYKELGVDEICDILVIHNLIFSHKPVKVAPDELNIHGHLHTEKMSTLGYQHINAYAVNFNKNGEPVLLDDILDSAYVQNADIVKDAKMLNHIEEKFEKYTSLSSSDEYHDILDLSDEFSLAPIDESTTKKDRNLNLFFVSEHGDYDETIVRPKIPDNYMTQNGFEDNTTPRVCFSTSIDGCLIALGQNITNKVFYVYQPVGKHKVVVPTEKQVPDVKITKERWICEPVELTCIGKIKAIDENGPKDDGIPYRYGPNKEHEARLYAWGYQWLKRFNESISPSIVSLSAKEDEDENSDPLDEILFPDVDSTRYWEADDDKANNKIDGLKYSDDRSTIKTIYKNDVVADGQTTLDESANEKKIKTPEMIFTFTDPKDKSSTQMISILAQDLFHEKIMIHPEKIDTQRIATFERIEELVAYFNSIAHSESAIVPQTGSFRDTYIAGSYMLRTFKGDNAKEIQSVLMPVNLSPDEFKQYVKNCIDDLNKIEEAICGLICANMAAIRIAIDDICAECLSPIGRAEIIKEAKKYVDDNIDDIKAEYRYSARNPINNKQMEYETIVFDYLKAGLSKTVVISGEMYHNKLYQKLMKPSRFLVRLGVYDVIVVVHGATVSNQNEDKWIIEPLKLPGGQIVNNLDDVVRYYRNIYSGRILVLSCNDSHIVPDNKLYDVVDYSSNTVLFESSELAVPSKNASTKSMLKDIIKYVPKKLKALNRVEAQILTAIDEFEFPVAPTDMKCVVVDEDSAVASFKSIEIKGHKHFRKMMGKTTGDLFSYYEKVLFRFMMLAKWLNIYRDHSITESGYKWSIKERNIMTMCPQLQNETVDEFVYVNDPTFGYNYSDIDEYANDIELYQTIDSEHASHIDLSAVGSISESADADVFYDIYSKITDPQNINDQMIPKSEVFFTREITPESLIKIFNLIYMPGDLPDGWRTMVKISTGEPGGHNYLKPELIGDLVKKIHSVICDTVTAYDGNRDTKEKQLKTMKDHGFTKIGPVDVLDGDGELVIPVKDGYMLQNVNAGKNIIDYDFHVILSHFKGHQMAGYGGAIKNVAIGCASRRGKSQIHTYGSTAEMTVGFLDKYDQQSFLKAMVDAAKSFIDVMKIKGPILYINIANNLSVDCDCDVHPADPTMEDIGIFASWDPVAVDQACIDAVYHAKDSHDLVERIESKDGTDILLYAEESGMGSRSYELINIDLVNENADGSLSLAETKEYNRTDDIGPMDRDEKKRVAEKYGLRAVGQEIPTEEEDRRKTPQEKAEERNKQRLESLKKARKVKKRKAFVRKVKSHLPGVKNEDIQMMYESDTVVDSSDDSTLDGIEHSPLYGDKKDFFYNYDYPKSANDYAQRLKLEEAVTEKEEPLTKQELAALGIRDLRTFQRWMKNNVHYKNMDRLMTPREVLEQKKGSCHDQVVLELAVLKTLGYHPSAYFVLEHDNKPTNSQGGETHSYVVVKDNNKLYWLENAWSRHAGLNEVPNPKFIIQAHKERAWGDSNKYPELEVVRFAGKPGDTLQELVDHCFNDKQEINEGVVGNLVKDLPAIMKNAGANAMYSGKWEVVEDGLMQLIQKADTMERVNYLRRDLRYGIISMEKLLDKMYRVQKGELENKDIKKRIAGGNTPDKLKVHLKWIRNTGLPALNARAKEIRKALKESYIFELDDPNLKLLDRLDEAATDNKKLYPVYIMLVHSGTTVSNVIKAVSHSEFSHAAISFDSSMDEMYSFARKDPRNPFIGGFRFESIGKGFYDQKEIPYAVYMVPCTESQIKKMKKRLLFFEKNATKFKFDFTGLIKNYLGIVDNPEYRWFCSRFVADILNAGAPKNKPYVEEPSLQDPDDFKNDEYAYFVISGSNLMKYDQKLVDKRTKQIIREIELEKKIKNESVVLDLLPMNPYESQVLSYQLTNMDESAFDNFVNYLKSFKLKFDKDGNLVIRRREYDQLDQHFRASLKLIKAAEKAGDIGTVKDELCKIYYMINLIQTQYLTRKPTPKTEKVYHSMENLRSVMLNAFHHHFKYVTERDPKFNFASYYETTKYGKDVTIDSNVLSAVGKTIVTILS